MPAHECYCVEALKEKIAELQAENARLEEKLTKTQWVARKAASKLKTMYMRREVEPRAELDDLIELFFG